MGFADTARLVETGVRLLVAGAFVLSLIIYGTHWAVRRQSIAPFGAWARFVRGMSDPLLKPLERRMVRGGANPQDAPLWLIGVVVLVGLILISGVSWLLGLVQQGIYMAQFGNRAVLAMVVHYVFTLLMAALLVRVVGSWLGVGRYNRWMRIPYLLTDWLMEPLGRVIPPIGMFDVSPLVAWLLLSFTQGLVMRAFFQG